MASVVLFARQIYMISVPAGVVTAVKHIVIARIANMVEAMDHVVIAALTDSVVATFCGSVVFGEYDHFPTAFTKLFAACNVFTLAEIILTVYTRSMVPFLAGAVATIKQLVGITRHTAGGATDDGRATVAVVNFGLAEEVAAVAASVVVAAYCIAMASIHSPMLFCSAGAAAEGTTVTVGPNLAGVLSIFKTLVNDSGLSATGAGGGDFFMTVVALANGLTAGKASVVLTAVATESVASGTFHMVALGYAHIVTARKLVMCFSNSAAGRASVFSTFIVVALAKQVTAEGAGLVDTAVADVCKASGALVMIASLAGLVVTV